MARSTISTFLKICGNMDIKQYGELSRFMKGVFLERQALPRYTTTWSVDTVVQFLKNSPDKTLLQLSCKLSM